MVFVPSLLDAREVCSEHDSFEPAETTTRDTPRARLCDDTKTIRLEILPTRSREPLRVAFAAAPETATAGAPHTANMVHVNACFRSRSDRRAGVYGTSGVDAMVPWITCLVSFCGLISSRSAKTRRQSFVSKKKLAAFALVTPRVTMQTQTVLPSLARCSAPRFGTGAVAVPRHARAQPCAVLMRPAAGRRPISLGPIRHAFVNPRALHHSGGSVPAKRRGHITTSASSGRPGLNEFPVADRRVELDKMTLAQLKPLCKGSGLKQGGKKQELVSRLLVNEFGTTDDEADIDPTQDIVGLAVEWRQGRSVGASGVSFRESDSVDRALKTSGFVDERAADANFGWKQGFDDGGYSRSSEARGDQHANSGQRESAAARVMGRTGGGFDDGAGSGWATDDDWYDREKEDAVRYNDAQAKTPPQRTPEERKEEKKELERVQRMSLQRRAAIVTALRTLATEREGFEADPRVHLSAVAVAIEKAYRAMKYSAFAKMDDRGRDVLVDINVATGTLAILAQKITRAGTVEWEVDDTDAFLEVRISHPTRSASAIAHTFRLTLSC